MESRPDLKLQRILENIRPYFDFLFRRGFCIVSVIFADWDYENWQVTMTAEDCLIQIYSDRGKVNVALSTLQLYHEAGLFELTDLIDLIKGAANLADLPRESPMNETESFQNTARLLEKHIDEVLREIGKIPLLSSTDNPLKTPLKSLGNCLKTIAQVLCSEVSEATCLFFDFAFDKIIAVRRS